MAAGVDIRERNAVSDNRPIVIAHRGASASAPENSLEAFRLAAELGAQWVELDTHLAADGEVVVVHDAHYPDGTLVHGVPSTARPAGVCLLDEALAVCDAADLGVNVEIKAVPGDADDHTADALIDAVLAILSARYPTSSARLGQLLITSFAPDTIDRVAAETDLQTGWLTIDSRDVDAIAKRVSAEGHVAVNPWDPLVTREYVDAAHEAGLAIYPWTVNDPERIAELAAWGVDGIITDVPDQALRVIGSTR
jgi:glycerophosphoryl diester phosphodiesterase